MVGIQLMEAYIILTQTQQQVAGYGLGHMLLQLEIIDFVDSF
jgi:hypothetical protein